MRPEKGKRESDKHQEQKQGIEESDVSIRISQAEPGIKIAHVLSPVCLVPEDHTEKAFFRPLAGDRITAQAYRFQIEFINQDQYALNSGAE